MIHTCHPSSGLAGVRGMPANRFSSDVSRWGAYDRLLELSACASPTVSRRYRAPLSALRAARELRIGPGLELPNRRIPVEHTSRDEGAQPSARPRQKKTGRENIWAGALWICLTPRAVTASRADGEPAPEPRGLEPRSRHRRLLRRDRRLDPHGPLDAQRRWSPRIVQLGGREGRLEAVGRSQLRRDGSGDGGGRSLRSRLSRRPSRNSHRAGVDNRRFRDHGWACSDHASEHDCRSVSSAARPNLSYTLGFSANRFMVLHSRITGRLRHHGRRSR
jgi:hypothetical protein